MTWLVLAGLLSVAMTAFTFVGFFGGRIWERRCLIKDWADQDNAWQDLADFVVEVEKKRAELFGMSLLELPEPGRHAAPPPYPGDTIPCLFHGSHPASDPPCDPPEDTDWLANSGLLAKIDTQNGLDEFARWLNSWTPPELPAARRGNQAGLTGRRNHHGR